MESSIYTSPIFKKVVLPSLADSIKLAHTIDPRRWTLTVYKDGTIRLTVGKAESITIYEHSVKLVIDEATARKCEVVISGSVLMESVNGSDVLRSIPRSRYIYLNINRKLEQILA